MSHHHDEDAKLSIGAVSRATGIPTETLRTWERRYGFPMPERADSGHRKYSVQTVERLQLVAEALSRGHRPANVVGATMETLRRLLDMHLDAPSDPSADPTVDPPLDSSQEAPNDDSESSAPVQAVTRLHPEGGTIPNDDVIAEWLAATMRLDDVALAESFERAWFRLGALDFFSQLAGPFLCEVGQAWFDGRIAVLHEQFASAQLGAFLLAHWRPLSARASGERVVCAALPGEFHSLGLHMLAVVLAMTGCQIVYLGCDVPLQTIVRAAEEAESELVLISLSSAAPPARSREQLDKLRAALPEHVRLIIGGGGAPEGVDNVERFDDLHHLQRWLTRNYLQGAIG